MIKTEKGSRDGIEVETFVEGSEYVAPDTISFRLAEVFLKIESAEKVVGKIEKKVIEPEIPKIEQKLEVKEQVEKPKSKPKNKPKARKKK